MDIQKSEDDCFRIEAEGMRKFQGYVEHDTLVISGTSKASSNDHGNLGGYFCLYVPEGYEFEKVPLDVGAGSLSVEISVGMGSLHLTGDVTESLTADCSMGELKLTLAGERTDFNFFFVILFPAGAIPSKQLLPVRRVAPYLEYKKHSVRQKYC